MRGELMVFLREPISGHLGSGFHRDISGLPSSSYANPGDFTSFDFFIYISPGEFLLEGAAPTITPLGTNTFLTLNSTPLHPQGESVVK